MFKLGVRIGWRAMERCSMSKKRETKILQQLTFQCQILWKYLFNKCSELFKSQENPDECKTQKHFIDIIKDKELLTNKFIEIPKVINTDFSGLWIFKYRIFCSRNYRKCTKYVIYGKYLKLNSLLM